MTPWSEPASTIIGVRAPGQGAFSVADPRIDGQRFNTTYRIVPWSASAPAVAGPGGPGGLAVADPRAASEWQGKGKYNVTPFEAPAGTVIGASATGNGAFAVADPRTGYPDAAHTNVLRVTKYDEPARCVTAADHVTGGALCVADPRSGIDKEKGDDYLSARHYGVVPWDGTAQAVTGSACHDNGKWSVADPRCAIGLPADKAKIVAVIRALDGTWHRPFTTLELAALQSLIDPDEFLEFHGTSDTAWRERIGNAVPAATAEAIGNVMLQTLMLAHAGETFVLSDTPVWVQPIVVAISVDPFREESVE